MTPKNKLLAAFVIIFVLLAALAMLLVVTVGGAVAAIANGLIGSVRRLFGFGQKNPEVGQSQQQTPYTSQRRSSQAYEGLDPEKRIDQPRE
ncbi:MAG: hypothetical protein IPH75_14415 [bacterium]|nr:hypothetical protein [bacterium]